MADSTEVVSRLDQKNVFLPEKLAWEGSVSPEKEAQYIGQSTWAEPFARYVAYDLSHADQKVRQETERKLNVMGYTVHDLMLNPQSPTSEGIYCYSLEPLPNHPDLPLLVLSQGTQAQDFATIHQDLDPLGPGREGIQSNAPAILKQLSDSLTRSKASKIVFAGHSLGGALSQLIVNEVLDKLAEPESSPFNQIKKLELSTFQSAGVQPDECERAQKSLIKAKENHPKLKVSCVAVYKTGDLVGGNTGEHLLCAQALGPEFDDVAVIKMDERKKDWQDLKKAVVDAGLALFVNPTIGTLVYQLTWRAAWAFIQDAYNRHVEPCFVTGSFETAVVLDKSSLKYEVLTNATPAEREKLQADMSSRDVLDQGTLGRYIQAIRNPLYWGTCEGCQHFFKEIFSTLNKALNLGSAFASLGSAVEACWNMKSTSLLAGVQGVAKFGLAVNNLEQTVDHLTHATSTATAPVDGVGKTPPSAKR